MLFDKKHKGAIQVVWVVVAVLIIVSMIVLSFPIS